MSIQAQIEELGQNQQAYMTVLEAARQNLPALLPDLLAALHHPEARIRSNVINILGVVGNQDIGQLIEPFAQDSDVTVRRSVAWAMPKLLAPDYGSQTLLILLEDEDAQVRNVAAQAIRHYEGETKFNLLATVIQNVACDFNVYLQLGATKDKRALPLLQTALNQPERKMRQIILKALESFGEDGAKTIMGQLHSPEAMLRGAAALSLGNLKYKPAASDGREPALSVAAAARNALKQLS